MPTPSIQTLVNDAQSVLALQNMTTIRSTMAVALANANTGTPLNPGLTNQQLINEARQVMTLPKSDIESIIVNQLMKFLNSPPAPGGAGANRQVIWNDAGILTGAAGLIYDGPSERLTVGQRIDIWKGLNASSSNVAVGKSALSATQAGANANTAVGNQAGIGLTTGANNVFVGSNAGFGGGTGGNNVAVGVGSLTLNTAGTDNTAIGNGSMFNVTGIQNTAVGSFSGNAITTGQNNVAVGYAAMGTSAAGAHTGNSNVMIGHLAGYSSTNITGADNVGIGRDTFRNLSSGAGNIAIGQAALNAITTSSNSVAVGTNALQLSTASDNVGIGAAALAANVAGTNQTAVGRSALTLATGSNNTAFGASAGSNITTGTNNICIGVSANASAATVSNELVVGSSTSFVGTNGAATTYFTTASALSSGTLPANCGFIRIYLNGSFVKIPVYGN